MSRISIPISLISDRFGLNRFTEGTARMPLANRFSNIRPISEFFDFKRISKPANFGEIQSRAGYNLSYFASNYAVVFAVLSIYSLLTNLLLLFVIVLVVGGMWGIGKLAGRDLEIGPIKATPSQLYTTLICVSIPLGLFASPISTVLWLIGASGVTILGHAAFMDKPIENAFSEEAV
ncbi:prenylated rab acceptor PRA1 [Wilcoxina mikolae CBS 423.85]|nr:prenylated rab acceptor PRA1 [Wilcoxina mikolae CBS 423.85]